jgi:hypothetical protein
MYQIVGTALIAVGVHETAGNFGQLEGRLAQ